jgi:hypothetical protein
MLPEFPHWYRTMPWEDWPLYMLLAERGPIGYLNDIMGVYRNHGAGLWSALEAAPQLEAKIRFLLSVRECLDPRHRVRISESVAKYREQLRTVHDAPLGEHRATGDSARAQTDVPSRSPVREP